MGVAEHGELGRLALVIGDLPDVEDARAHHLRDRLARGVARQEVLAHRQVAREETPVGASLFGEPFARAQRDAATLHGRVASLGGNLVIDSSDHGARLEITLPLSEADR